MNEDSVTANPRVAVVLTVGTATAVQAALLHAAARLDAEDDLLRRVDNKDSIEWLRWLEHRIAVAKREGGS